MCIEKAWQCIMIFSFINGVYVSILQPCLTTATQVKYILYYIILLMSDLNYGWML
jgi:hypothetical protein